MNFENQIHAAVDSIRQVWDATPRFAVILGTGAGHLASEIQAECEISYGNIPHFPRSTALGHVGRLVCGKLAGQPVVAMQGRFHLYEGYAIDVATLPIHVFHRLGVQTLFVSNAAGGINPKFSSGDIMLINSHLDFMFRTSPNLLPAGDFAAPRCLMRSDGYDMGLIQQALACGRRHGFAIHQGVYAAMLGPNYETRAEYRFLRRIGADVAGMSTVPEVTAATRYGMRVLGLSIVTNVAKPDVLEPTSGEEVINAAEVAAPRLSQIVIDAITHDISGSATNRPSMNQADET